MCWTSERLAQEISDSRRKGDQNPDHAVLTLTAKLARNSLYNVNLLNKHLRHKFSYYDASDVNEKINTPQFQNLDAIEENILCS